MPKPPWLCPGVRSKRGPVQTLGANLFTADTTFLSDSIFTSRGRLARADGGATNTGRLDNFSFTIDGEEIAALPDFSWHLGYRHLQPGSET